MLQSKWQAQKPPFYGVTSMLKMECGATLKANSLSRILWKMKFRLVTSWYILLDSEYYNLWYEVHYMYDWIFTYYAAAERIFCPLLCTHWLRTVTETCYFHTGYFRLNGKNDDKLMIHNNQLPIWSII